MDHKIAAIILAAGGSKRFGSPKQLLMWQGETLINRVINLAISTNLDPITVVLGSDYEIIIKNIIVRSKVRIIKNENWEVGQSTSLIMGVKEIEIENIPFVVLLCDQPQVNIQSIHGLINTYLETDVDVVITEIEGKKTPPVIFNPVCIDGINSLKGDRGARSLIQKYRYETYVESDNRLLLDIDTPEDYQKLIKLYNCV